MIYRGKRTCLHSKCQQWV